MSINVLPYPRFRAWGSDNAPLAGGKLYTYEPGTALQKPVYQDADLSIPHDNPVILDTNGEAMIYTAGSYKYVLHDALDVLRWEEDNVGDPFNPSDAQWVLDKNATFASSTSFTISGEDLTALYHSNRPVRAIGPLTGTVYGDITTSSFSVDTTTVHVAWRSGTLSNETLAVAVGIVSVDLSSAGVNYYPPKPWEIGVKNHIYPYGDIRRFGASPSESPENNTTAIQNAHDSSVAAENQFNEVIFPAGKYDVVALRWSPLVTGKAEGKVVLRTTITSGYLLHISTEHGNWISVADQIPYAGNIVLDGYFVFENLAANTAIGIWFGDDNIPPQTRSAESITLRGIRLRGFSVGMAFGSHAYLITISDFHIFENGSALHLHGPTNYIDRLERITFTNGTFAGNTNVIFPEINVGGDVVFSGVSFDYNTRVIAKARNQLIVNFVGGCHFEWSSDQTYINAYDSSINLSDYYTIFAGPTPNPMLFVDASGSAVVKTRGAAFNTPGSTTLFTLNSSTGTLQLEPGYKQFGGDSTYFSNPGDGTVFI